MIIIQNPTKDTYVTDIQTRSNNAIYSNVGQSSTIDLFKICGENLKTHSRALITVNDVIVNGNTFSLKDALGNTVTFVIRTLEETIDGSVEVDGENKKVKIGLSGANTTLEKRDRFVSAINNVNSFNNGLAFDVVAYKLYDNKILLKQNKPGSSGDTVPVVPSNENSVTITNFVRFEHSAGLLKFDLTKIKNKYGALAANRANSVYRDNASLKFSAFIRLIDVGKSSTKPKDFKLKINVLNNDFKEGLGKDVVHFSDIDDANFVTINSKSNIQWANSGIVSSTDLFENSQFSFNEFEVLTGKEDIEFDITNYFHNFIKETSGFDKESFVIHFPTEYLFDNNTYFVKRLGSRNLKNKQYIPQLILKIEDDEIENIIIDKKRYFDIEEIFYLLNIKGNTARDFANDNVFLKLKYIGDNNENIYDSLEFNSADIYNFKGEKITGIKKFIIGGDQISQITSDSTLKSDIEKLGYATIELEYFYRVNNVESTIKKDKIRFYVTEMSETSSNISSRNIRVSIDLLQKNLKANNTITSLKVTFVDINAQYKSLNVPSQIYSEDLGNITYEMYDVDTGNKLIEDEGKYTQLNFNGRHYNLNIFASENFKNKRVNFVFSYTDPLTGLDKKFSNDNINLRFV